MRGPGWVLDCPRNLCVAGITGKGHLMATEDDGGRRAEVRAVKEAVEDELLARPGVVGVDIGEKVTKGEDTGELGIIVYVTEKKPEEELAADDVIPVEFRGVKTDVRELTVELQ